MTSDERGELAAPQRLSRADWRIVGTCVLLAALSVGIIVRYFSSAFPEASIDFKYDRRSSEEIAANLLRAQAIDVKAMKHAARFESDGHARIFLERSLGLKDANGVMRNDVRVWWWHHRWFRPLVEEEMSVDVAPTGEIVSFTHKIPEDRAIGGRGSPEAFLRGIGVNVAGLTLVERSERKLPGRIQRIYTYESKSVRPANAPYRHTVTIDGNVVTSYSQRLKVPDTWLRSYRELRSKNSAAGSVDLVFHIALLIAAVVVFIVRLRRGDLPLRFLLGIAMAAIVLVGGVALNSLPAQLGYYDTTTSYPAFIGNLVLFAVIECLGTGMILIVVCGAGEILYRQRLPQHLAMPLVWTRKSLTSRRVFLSLVVGYALVPMFIAYQVAFYLVGRRFGAWAPAEVPYDDMLNTALPWVAVLFAGFFPAFSEEFLSRAFAIPVLQRFLRSRYVAIVVAAFIWGFGHSTYPNQPFWIRGVEVGIAGIVAGLLMDRFGLLALLIWHYTIDAVYTATLLFASGNAYYIGSASITSLLFAIPLVASIASYVRHRGFLPDHDLTNATMPVAPSPEHPEVAAVAAQFPDPIPVTARRISVCVALVIAAALAMLFRPVSPDDALDYRITAERAKEIARAHVRKPFAHVIATPVEGFRYWDGDSPREEGGAPGGFDDVAARYILGQGDSGRLLADVFRRKIEAGTWMVRFFTPLQKEEIFVEVDPRTERVVGYHKYQDEYKAGAKLAQEQALRMAMRAFAAYGLQEREFELKETLSFRQLNRQDWLFHFQERWPLIGDAFRRVTIRVQGAEVTQFNKTVKVPEKLYREAETETLLNVALYLLKIIGIVAVLALMIVGVVIATRAHGLPWRRALRWTAVLSVIPIAGFVWQYESILFTYSTTVAWETFRVSLATAFVRDVGLKVGLMFLALAGLEAAVPYATSLFTAESRSRFGRAAVIAALIALSTLTLADLAMQYLEVSFPAFASVSIAAPIEVAIPFPALYAAGQAVFGAILFSAAVALYVTAVRKHIAIVTIIAVFFASIDPRVTQEEAAFIVVRSLVAALLIWIVARFVLSGNPLAWPIAVFTGAMLQTSAALFRHHRPDLLANAIALLVLTVVALMWTARKADA